MFELWVGVSSTSLPITTNTIHSTSKVKDHLTRLRPPKSGFYYYYDVSLMDSDCCVQFGTFGRRTLLLNILLWSSIYSWNNETTRLRPDYSRKKILHEQYLFLKLYAINQTSDFNHVLLFMYICFGTFRILLTSRVSELFCFSVERTGMDFERNSMRIWPYNLVDKVSIFVPA